MRNAMAKEEAEGLGHYRDGRTGRLGCGSAAVCRSHELLAGINSRMREWIHNRVLELYFACL